MSKAYLIEGESGDYDECMSWPFGVFLSKDSAEIRLSALQQKLNELKLDCHQGYRTDPTLDQRVESMLQLDSNFREHYTGASYRLTEVDLIE